MHPPSALKIIFPFILLCTLQTSAQDSLKEISISFSILSGSRVTVIGSTNVNEFSCFTESNIFNSPLKVSSSHQNTIASFADAELKIKTESLNCGNAVMNANLCSAMHGDKFPFIVIDIDEVKASDGKPIALSPGQNLNVQLYLTLAGRKKLNIVKVHVQNEGAGNFHFVGSHKISLSSYGIDPPKAFFGLIKVNDAMTVKFDLIVHVEEKKTIGGN